MGEEIRLNDIADELLILNKITIDKLFQLDNCSDCIALYVFYYKTAKWQKTDTIRANDTYVRKCLKWGSKKVQETKKTLKENGLIDIVQRRTNNKIEGWYIRVSYLVAQRKTEDIKVQVEESNNTQKQQHSKATSSFEETNALKEKIKCLKREIEMLKDNNNSPAEAEQVIEKVNYQKIISRLNELAGTNYKPTSKKTRELIDARIKEGFTEEDLITVIEKMCYLWNREPKKNEVDMRPYLRPITLFQASKFEGYLNRQIQERKLTTKDIQDKIDFSDF